MKKKHPFLYVVFRRAIVLVLILLMILTAYHQSSGQLVSPEGFFSGLITPVQGIVSKAGQLFSDYLYRVKLRSNIEYEYNQLKAQNDELILRSMLYEELERILKSQGFHSLVAVIAAPDEEPDPYLTRDSLKFHAAMGYTKAGELHQCGYKFGRWYNIVHMEKLL